MRKNVWRYFFITFIEKLLSQPAKVINNLAGQGKEIACDKQLKTFSHTVKLGYNDQLGTGHFLFVITGVCYNRVNLCSKMTNFT